jgi:hypothetical protein
MQTQFDHMNRPRGSAVAAFELDNQLNRLAAIKLVYRFRVAPVLRLRNKLLKASDTKSMRGMRSLPPEIQEIFPPSRSFLGSTTPGAAQTNPAFRRGLSVVRNKKSSPHPIREGTGVIPRSAAGTQLEHRLTDARTILPGLIFANGF